MVTFAQENEKVVIANKIPAYQEVFYVLPIKHQACIQTSNGRYETRENAQYNPAKERVCGIFTEFNALSENLLKKLRAQFPTNSGLRENFRPTRPSWVKFEINQEIRGNIFDSAFDNAHSFAANHL
jgi:hypothetical protein